jgi:hypothetical protein
MLFLKFENPATFCIPFHEVLLSIWCNANQTVLPFSQVKFQLKELALIK